EKTCLSPHALSGAVHIIGPERHRNQFLESRDLLRLTPKLIVKPQQLRDESGTKPERQLSRRRGCGASGRLRHYLALERPEAAGRVRKAPMENVVEFVARDENRAFESASELFRSAGGRHDNHLVGGRLRRVFNP
ncbi:MAG TPA: hypothetical protein VGH34_20920, partial [Vicinamibacterales bacterium]